MVFILMSHMHGNVIMEYDLCRLHVGGIKRENCAMYLVGLERIRTNREHFYEPAWYGTSIINISVGNFYNQILTHAPVMLYSVLEK